MSARERTIADDCFCGRVGDDYTLLLCQVDAPIPFVLTARGRREARMLKQWDAIKVTLTPNPRVVEAIKAAQAEGRKLAARVAREAKNGARP